MVRALNQLTPLQRIRRVRRLVREMQGQRALLLSAPAPRDAVDARERLRTAAPVVQIPTRQQRRPTQSDQLGDFQRAVDLEDARAAGKALSEADAAWLRSYQTHPDYKAGMMIFKKAGRAMFG